MTLFLYLMNQTLLDSNFLLNLPHIAHLHRIEWHLGTCSLLRFDLKEFIAWFDFLVILLHICRPTVCLSYHL